MENEENSIYDEAEVKDVETTEDIQMGEDDQEEAWAPRISKESPKEKKERLGEKKEMDGKTLTVKEYFFTKPRTKNSDGTAIEPKETIDKTKKFYPGKLGLKFEEDNLVEYYPNFHYFVDETGKVGNFAKINRNGENAISSLFKLIIKKMGRPEEEVSDQEAFEFLVGKKVKIKTSKGTYLGKSWFRNDIVEILD